LYDYAQTKAATMNYVKSLAKQLAKRGIRVNGVAPGPIWTPLQVSGGASMEKLEKFGSQSPLGRPGQPAELASIYVQLAAADASYTTGNIYGAGGGQGQPYELRRRHHEKVCGGTDVWRGTARARGADGARSLHQRCNRGESRRGAGW